MVKYFFLQLNKIKFRCFVVNYLLKMQNNGQNSQRDSSFHSLVVEQAMSNSSNSNNTGIPIVYSQHRYNNQVNFQQMGHSSQSEVARKSNTLSSQQMNTLIAYINLSIDQKLSRIPEIIRQNIKRDNQIQSIKKTLRNLLQNIQSTKRQQSKQRQIFQGQIKSLRETYKRTREDFDRYMDEVNVKILRIQHSKIIEPKENDTSLKENSQGIETRSSFPNSQKTMIPFNVIQFKKSSSVNIQNEKQQFVSKSLMQFKNLGQKQYIFLKNNQKSDLLIKQKNPSVSSNCFSAVKRQKQAIFSQRDKG